MIKGLPKAVTLAMFVVLAVIALCAASASARPYGITCGHKKCVPPKHHHHGCSGKRKHHKCKHRHRSVNPNHQSKPPSESSTCKVVVTQNGHVVTEEDRCESQPASEPAPEPKKESKPQEVCLLSSAVRCGPPCCCADCVEVLAEEELFEVKGLEVYQNVGEYVPVSPPNIWASAEVTYPYMDSVTTVFYAEYGSFSQAYGGIVKPSILTPGRYSEYVPPCAEEMPSDGYDTAWVVVYDHTTKEFVESEHVKFNITEPENVHEVHPLG